MEVHIDGYLVLIDEEDAWMLDKWTWHVNIGKVGGPYLRRSTHINGKRVVWFHREIMNTCAKMQVDHIDGNTLNNNKYNLRICSHSENQWNREKYKTNKSGYKGVSFNSYSGLWVSQIQRYGRKYFMGYHDTPEKAYEAYKKKALELHGEFAHF